MSPELVAVVDLVHQATGYPADYLLTCRRPDDTIIRHSGLPAARWEIWRHAHTNGVPIETIAATYGVTTRWVRKVIDATDP